MIDMLVGIGITAIVLGTAIPNLRTLTEPYKVDTASRVVASDFAVARMRAIAQNRRYRIVLNGDGGWWEMQAETAPNVFTTVNGRRTLPDGVHFGTIAGTPVFNTRGMLTSGFSVSVSSAGRQRTVSVSMLGDATVSHTQAVAG